MGFGSEGVVCLTELFENLAKELDITVFSFVEIKKGYQPKGYKLIGVPLGDNSKYVVLRSMYLFASILRLHLSKKFDVFHGFWALPAGFLTLFVGKLFKKKTIVTFMGGEVANISSINYGLFQSKFTKKSVQFIARQVDCIVALTYYHASKLKENIDFKVMEIIPFGVNLSKFPFVDKALCSPYQFIYIGNLNQVKDLNTLLKTFQKICLNVEARLDIIGLDTLQGKIQVLVSELNLSDKVLFHGPKLNHELKAFLGKSHILLHTSVWESQAVVVNEALASGVVVCGTIVGILADLENELARVVAVGDFENLAKKVIELLENPTEYYELRDKGIAWSKENDFYTQSQKYIKLYENILAKD